ncbi:uncharacterized protein LOC124687813 [Lolium rigidum]|nr:uncharacterized protein LOC124687813 [Lolium rigidum]
MQGIGLEPFQSTASSPFPSPTPAENLTATSLLDLLWPPRPCHEHQKESSPALSRLSSGRSASTPWFPAPRRTSAAISSVPVRPEALDPSSTESPPWPQSSASVSFSWSRSCLELGQKKRGLFLKHEPVLAQVGCTLHLLLNHPRSVDAAHRLRHPSLLQARSGPVLLTISVNLFIFAKSFISSLGICKLKQYK